MGEQIHGDRQQSFRESDEEFRRDQILRDLFENRPQFEGGPVVRGARALSCAICCPNHRLLERASRSASSQLFRPMDVTNAGELRIAIPAGASRPGAIMEVI
jgi:hypothetical protein